MELEINEKLTELETYIIGKKLQQVIVYIGYKPVYTDSEQAVFVIKKFLFNTMSKKLYVYLKNNKVRDYYIGIL